MSFNSDPALLGNQLPLSIDFPREQDKFLETLTSTYKRIANAVNTKEGGLYTLQELFNSQQYFIIDAPNTFRNVYRKVFDVVYLNSGNVAGGATVTFPHNISGLKYATRVYASCTSTTPEFFSVVYPNVKLTDTNLVFTNPLAGTALTSIFVIAEYLKS